MEKGVTSEADYYVKGKISSIKFTFSAQYGTATFNISDDGATGGKEFIAYSCYYFGNQPWVEGNTQVQVGDEVIVCGKVVNYNGNTPEFASKKNYLVKLNSQTAASRRK
jgi:exonuclease VII large subunit